MDRDFCRYFLNIVQKSMNVPCFSYQENGFYCDLILVKSWLFGRKLISLGYLTEGGLIKDSLASECDQTKIIARIQQLATDHHVDYIEFRGGIKPDIPDLKVQDQIYADFIKDFQQIDDVLLSIPRKKRADIRKAINNQHLHFTDNVDINDFYALFSKSQHDHGTPIHRKKYYKLLVSDPNKVQIYGIMHGKTLVACCMVFVTETEIIAYYGAADANYVKHHVYDLLYYHLMCVSKQRKTVFNFGRSKYNTGSFKYKTLWGFEPLEKTHYIWPITDKKIPDLRANNQQFAKKIALWRKLPLWLVNLIGPFILKGIG